MMDEFSGRAVRHAESLLAPFGLAGPPFVTADHPAIAWRRGGLQAITGLANGRGLVSPVPLTIAADAALAALRHIAPAADLPATGAVLLGERARLLGLRRAGMRSVNGSCRLLTTQDGHAALNLPRAADWELVPALLERDAADWHAIGRAARLWTTSDLVDRGRLLGLAIAASEAGPVPPSAAAIIRLAPASIAAEARPLVVDLSSLWAGPLAASLLLGVGAEVVKVEAMHRPDGARAGHAGFYDLLNAGKRSVALDLGDERDLARLRSLVERADIVIEASRPRALRQLGIDAAAVARRGGTWLSITGHGREGDVGEWIGFGDDAAVAGGLAAAMADAWGAQLFAGDAIADPLTGITAAALAWASWCSGGGTVIDIALSRVVAHARGLGVAADIAEWQRIADRDDAPLYSLRPAAERAAALGADTARVLRGV